MDLPPELYTEIARQASTMCEQYVVALHDVFFKLKQSIDQRKLFVMFEDILMCNPQSDHLIPKSTLPIFDSFISEAELALEKIGAALLHTSIYNFKERVLYKEVGLRDELHQRLQELEGRYACEISVNLRSAESISQLYMYYGKLVGKLQHVQQIRREGQVSSTRFGGIFKPDYQLDSTDVARKGSLEDRIRSMYAQLDISKQRLYKAEKALSDSVTHSTHVIQELNAYNGKLSEQVYDLKTDLQKILSANCGSVDGTNAAASVTDYEEFQSIEDAKKVIRYLNEQLYDSKLLSQKLGEKLRAKNRIIGLSVGVTNYFSRISGVNRVIAQNLAEKADDPLNVEIMEEYFTYLAKLQLQLKELESQNGVLRVALQTQDKVNQRIFGEAVLEPELVSGSYYRFIGGQDELQDMLSSGTRGARTLASIMEESGKQELYLEALDAYQPGVRAFQAEQQTISLLISENQRLKEQLARVPEIQSAEAYNATNLKNQPTNASIFALNHDDPYPEDKKALSVSSSQSVGKDCKTDNPARPLEYERNRNSKLGSYYYIGTCIAGKGSYATSKYDEDPVSAIDNASENVSVEPLSKTHKLEVPSALPQYCVKPAIQAAEAPKIKSCSATDISNLGQQGKILVVSSKTDSCSDLEGPRDLFMLNENLMRTIEYSSEIDDSRIDRELILLENWDSEAEEEHQQPSKAPEQACAVWLDYKKLLKIVQQQRHKIKRSYGLVHDLLRVKQKHEAAEPSFENVGKPLPPISQLLDDGIKGNLIIPDDFRHGVLDRYNGIVAPSGLIVFSPKQQLSYGETYQIQNSAREIGADIQISPELYRFIQIIEFEAHMLGEDLPSTAFLSTQQAFDYLKYLSKRYFTSPSTETPIGYCPTQLGLLISSETQTTSEVPADQQNSQYGTADLKLASLNDEPPNYRDGLPLFTEEIDYSSTTIYEYVHGDSAAAIVIDGKEVTKSTVAQVFSYLNGLFPLDYSPETSLVQYLAKHLKYLVSYYESTTEIRSATLFQLHGQLDDALQAYRDFSQILAGWRSVGIYTNCEAFIQIEQRLYTAKQLLIDKHKGIAIPEYCISEADVFARLYNHALRIRRQIEYLEAKYYKEQCYKLGIIELKIRVKNARPNIVKPLLVRPDGRDYNARGRILHDAGLSKDPLSKEHFTIVVKPFK